MTRPETVNIEQRPDGYAVIVGRQVQAPLDKAYAAWTEPAHLNNWFTNNAEVDLRVGGAYKNGDNDHGTYLIVEPNRIRFTWDQSMHCAGSEVDVSFREDGDTTQVTLTHEKLADRKDAEDLAVGGWDWAMDSYRRYLETGTGISYENWKAERN